MTPFFSQSVYIGNSESKKFGLFKRHYFMDGTLAKIAKIRLGFLNMFPVLVILWYEGKRNQMYIMHVDVI